MTRKCRIIPNPTMTINTSKPDANQPSIRARRTSPISKNTRYSDPPGTSNVFSNKRGSPNDLNDLEKEDKRDVKVMEGQEPPGPHTVSPIKEPTATAAVAMETEGGMV